MNLLRKINLWNEPVSVKTKMKTFKDIMESLRPFEVQGDTGSFDARNKQVRN